MRRTALGKALRLWAVGRSLFPEGEGRLFGGRKAGAAFCFEDLAQYSPREREPIAGHYRGWTSHDATTLVGRAGVVAGVTSVGRLRFIQFRAQQFVVDSLVCKPCSAFADRAEHMGI